MMIEKLVFIGSILWIIIPGSIFLFLSIKGNLTKNQKSWRKGALYAFLIILVIKLLN